MSARRQTPSFQPPATSHCPISRDGTADGRRLAVDIRDQDQDIWAWDFDRETLTKLTFGPAVDTSPLWTLDGHRIIFFTNGQGLRSQASDGTGSVESLTESGPKTQNATGFTHDGKHLIFGETTGAGANERDIRVLDVDGHGITDLLADPKIAEADSELSPDGRWLAYESNESGRYEIYVRPFPDVQSGRWQISRDGGTRPMWARNGRELYFMAGGLYNSPVGSALMVVSVETSPAFRAGNPQQLLPGPYFSNLGNRTYDVSADGQRFLMVKRAGPSTAAPDRIVVVDNWFEELKRRVPIK
jgi:serine/threonine-protein kinase